MKIFVIALNTFREAVRNKILYSVVVFAAFLVGVSAFFGSVSIGEQERVIKDFGLFALSFCGAIITILTGVTLLNKELKQKTIYHILSKPVARWQFIFGKHLGLSCTVSLLVFMMGLGLFLFTACFEESFDWLLLQAMVFVLLEVCVIAAVTMFFSSLVVTTTLTGMFTLGTYVAGHSITYFKYFLQDPEFANPALERLIVILDWVIPDLSLFNVADQIVYGRAASPEQLAYAVLYAASYSLVALSLASLIFRQRELT